MRNFIRRTDKMDIYIEPSRKTIVVRQRWKYVWLVQSGMSSWTYEEKREWHHKADNIIWQSWGENYEALLAALDASGDLKDLHLSRFKVEFDIEWVLENEHWEVEVTKILAGTSFSSRVDITNRIVYVAAFDVEDTFIDFSRPNISFNTFNHEYGHTLYPKDDYGTRFGNVTNGPYSSDLRGLMTIGNEFRVRYVSDLTQELNAMIPGARFTLRVL